MNWIFRLCMMNMKRRKIRTFLTVLGVTIGVISIVSLLSIGIGVKDVLLGDYERKDTVRRITVYGEESGKRKDKMLTKKTIENLGKLSHVERAYPVYEIYPIQQLNQYTGYGQICGIPREEMEKFDLTEGSELGSSKRKPELVFGNLMGTMFYNMSSGMSYSETENKKTKDMLGKKLNVTFEYGENVFSDKFSICAVMEGKENDYSMESQMIYCDLDVLLKYLKRNSKDGVIFGQPVDEEGKALFQDFIYSNAVVIVDDINEVDAVVKKLQDMGFQTENEKEYLDAVKKNLKIVEVLLGGIGMIALVVAVIGISNTMTTAVYDRIHEIGILKVLGCDMDELLILFLLEAGILGAAGGIAGSILSLGIRGLINKIGVAVLAFEKGTQLAVIPWWLVLTAVIFSTVLGILAGYVPARYAAKLKPMEAVVKS